MQAMQNEIQNLRQGAPANGAAPTNDAPTASGPIAGVGAAPANVGAPEMPIPVSAISLMQWMGMNLDTFDGSGTPVQAADWLTYVEDKMDVFEVVYQDRVAHPAMYGSMSWHAFVRQFERRFYPATFLDKMKMDLHNYVQDKKTVTEYEVGFNQIVRFVPHVAYNDMEKAIQFRQGLRPSIRHMLGAFPLIDFRTIEEQALGLELQHLVTTEMHKSSGGEQSHSQSDKKGQSGGPIHKKGKFQHHQPYHGKSSQSSISDKNATHYRAVAKPGMGLVCFRCGDAHRRSECRWTGKCSICGMDHRDVVCRRNPNGKVHWEVVPSSTSASSGGSNTLCTAATSHATHSAYSSVAAVWGFSTASGYCSPSSSYALGYT
ncbi:hypothetical protein PVAP13_8NG151206 [Panicum virgatum]|uniref:Retrotransposon gag domain-containing protein n=1 Tax=Panicum virgatum TaxID=38727 RepID=A0A8T0P6J4_PANVG|nr:hypothetical protein PVAP13_8NG151206 [Panicum virgatum]